MEAGLVLITIAIAMFTFVIGLFVGKVIKKPEMTHGILNVSYSESESPGLFLVLTVPVEDIVNQKHARFDVNVLHSNSQK